MQWGHALLIKKMLLFCVSHELACLKKKKEKHFSFSLGHLATFWFSTFGMLFHAMSLVGHENTRSWMVYLVIKASKFTV